MNGTSTDSEIIVYTDGGCSGNPGAGGWGIVIIADGIAKQLSGGEAMTTNNKMELSAAIAALSVIKTSGETTPWPKPRLQACGTQS